MKNIWNDFPDENKADLFSLDEDLFLKIGVMLIEEYEKEFGNQSIFILQIRYIQKKN